MEPPSSTERASLAASADREDRSEFARRIGNHRPDPYRLRQALYRTARQTLEARGLSAAAVEALAPLPAPPPAWRGVPTTGTVKVFALLIEFPDEPHHNKETDIDAALFGSPPTGFPYESLTAYYRRSSYELLNFTGATLGWYKSTKNRSAIPQTDAGRDALIKQAIQHFNAQGHDFSQYDNNHDGVVDYFLVFWTGKDTGWSTFWWGYQTGFSDPGFTVDGVRLGKYSWQWEANPVGTAFSPVTSIHETGHALGLPDLYDYDPKVGPVGGVGGADMMDANQFDHNCFSKWMLEWLTPTLVVTGCQTITLPPTSKAPQCVAIWPLLELQGVFSELFMVQNRQPTENDVDLPGRGLMIWHVDASLNPSGQDFLYDNSYTSHKYIRLMEGDGKEHIEGGFYGFDPGDLYTPGETFGPDTQPSSATYAGKDSGVEVLQIVSSGADITADMCVNQSGAKIEAPTNLSFGFVKVGTTKRKKLTIRNVGSSTLTCTISWGKSKDFSVATSGGKGMCGGNTPAIAPGSSCFVWVTFKPTKPMVATYMVVTIDSNDPNTPHAEVLAWGAGAY